MVIFMDLLGHSLNFVQILADFARNWVLFHVNFRVK